MSRTAAAGPGSERGQAVVELVLLAPLVVTLVLVIVALGDALNAYLTVVTLARDGSRLGSQPLATDAVVISLIQSEGSHLRAAVPGTCVEGEAGICITRPGLPAPGAVTVRVCYDHPLIVRLPGLESDTLLMCSSTTHRVLS